MPQDGRSIVGMSFDTRQSDLLVGNSSYQCLDPFGDDNYVRDLSRSQSSVDDLARQPRSIRRQERLLMEHRRNIQGFGKDAARSDGTGLSNLSRIESEEDEPLVFPNFPSSSTALTSERWPTRVSKDTTSSTSQRLSRLWSRRPAAQTTTSLDLRSHHSMGGGTLPSPRQQKFSSLKPLHTTAYQRGNERAETKVNRMTRFFHRRSHSDSPGDLAPVSRKISNGSQTSPTPLDAWVDRLPVNTDVEPDPFTLWNREASGQASVSRGSLVNAEREDLMRSQTRPKASSHRSGTDLSSVKAAAEPLLNMDAVHSPAASHVPTDSTVMRPESAATVGTDMLFSYEVDGANENEAPPRYSQAAPSGPPMDLRLAAATIQRLIATSSGRMYHSLDAMQQQRTRSSSARSVDVFFDCMEQRDGPTEEPRGRTRRRIGSHEHLHEDAATTRAYEARLEAATGGNTCPRDGRSSRNNVTGISFAQDAQRAGMRGDEYRLYEHSYPDRSGACHSRNNHQLHVSPTPLQCGFQFQERSAGRPIRRDSLGIMTSRDPPSPPPLDPPAPPPPRKSSRRNYFANRGALFSNATDRTVPNLSINVPRRTSSLLFRHDPSHSADMQEIRRQPLSIDATISPFAQTQIAAAASRHGYQ